MAKSPTRNRDVALKQSPQPQSNFAKWMTRVAAVLLLAATFTWLDRIKDRWYVLEPKFLHELAQEAIAASPNNPQGMISHILTNLTSTYPQLESPALSLNLDSSEWVFNNAGGAMGAMYILHASVTEYLIIFGTPLGTEGHTGLHTADDYFHILVGEQWAFRPGALEMERYGPGDVHFLPRGTAKQYKMHEGCFALEYARGWIPLMMPFGLADTFTSTLDIPTLYHTIRITGRETIKNLLLGKI
ncbi:ERG2 and sigma1 receptor-like protein [Rhizopogon vinicolor AM-OR11-026]|uniref:C-8 sterol isomerase n=1 Tax=Rhizopogon vinicolor AM-OR11-026 TaxID=1314800 RepID=A0A1B7MVK6_9AGAM|nr:ERG2 and sigma1 receptor-like protein [Rhizopogon vinicolor AM-OR11-026]